MSAYAIAITEDNLRGVIHSEAGVSFDLELSLQWLYEYEAGWFIRDPDSPFDCAFMAQEVFDEVYTFLSADSSELIRRVVQI